MRATREGDVAGVTSVSACSRPAANVVRQRGWLLGDGARQGVHRVEAHVRPTDLADGRRFVDERERQTDLDVWTTALPPGQLLQEVNRSVELPRRDGRLPVLGGEHQVFRLLCDFDFEALQRRDHGAIGGRGPERYQ